MFAPENLGRTIELINAAVKAVDRRIDWIHIPTLDRTDEAFYAPLAGLDAPGTRVYLGMIHSMDSFKERLSVARKFLPDFGLAAYCGFGRTPPEQMPQVLQDHLKAVELNRSASS